MTPSLPPLALYVHIPWCVRKCPYCDFNSHEAGAQLPEADYVAALREDLAADAHLANGRPLEAIFFGGGTPSLFSGRAIGEILAAAEAELGFSRDIEITLEANPGTAEHGNFRDLWVAGVNRLSLGIQSFEPRHLARLGRIHGREEAERAYGYATAAGFDNINLDLMHGLPDQTPTEALDDIDRALGLAPAHISWYQLTIEPNTVFYSRPPRLPEDDALADIQDAGHARLSDAGYRQYEVSAYARPGRQSRHNRNYWEFGDYLAIGAGAHGKIMRPGGRILRYHKTRQPRDYLAGGERTAGREVIAPENLPLEFMMNALRLTEGVPLARFSERTGLPWSAVDAVIQSLARDELVEVDATRLRTTELGQRFLNEVLARFVEPAETVRFL